MVLILDGNSKRRVVQAKIKSGFGGNRNVLHLHGICLIIDLRFT